MSELEPAINYTEANVPTYVLPALLANDDGSPIIDTESWHSERRPEILRFFQEQMYGVTPQTKLSIRYTLQEASDSALAGLAERKQIGIQVGTQSESCTLNLLVYLPAKANGPKPIFLGLNFEGNHTVHTDSSILLSEGVVESGKDTESARGLKSSRWSIEKIIEQGYGFATIYCGDMAIDNEDSWRSRAYAKLLDPVMPRQPNTVGAIGIWAWGLSRAMDYFETDRDVDATRIAVMGHSRLGKTALWAAAQDERFRLVISNNSGCGGAALSRRCFGETVHAINSRFPHWFCENFRQYNQNETALPIDQHMLLALIAPRPLYVASAEEDKWADPYGEFLGIQQASPVYELYDQSGLSAAEMPAANRPIVGSIGYHIRSGDHDVTDYDWIQYLNFADNAL